MTNHQIGFDEEESEKIRVCGVVRDDGACALYRVVQPIASINEKFGIDAALGGVGCKDSDLFTLLQDCDVAIVPRAASEKMLDLIKLLKSHTPPKKVIVDHDDNIFMLNPLSPHYRDMGLENISYTMGGKKVVVWQDGENNFDITKNKHKTEAAKECLRLADAITVTTPELAEYYSEFNSNVIVLPNCIDLELWKPVKLVKDKTVRVTWHGGCSHYQDLVEVKPVFENITAKNKNVKLEICGHEFSGVFKNVPKKQYQFHAWVSTPAHPYKQALLNADIAIIPLKDDLFNQCKSAIKWVEYSALEVPCVMKNIPPYSKVVEHGVTGFLYDTPEECERMVQRLIDNDALRRRIGQNAREYIVKNFDAVDRADLWADALKHVMEGSCL
jgi:glycosyltransferase involved in cell wall biosynthesis